MEDLQKLRLTQNTINPTYILIHPDQTTKLLNNLIKFKFTNKIYKKLELQISARVSNSSKVYTFYNQIYDLPLFPDQLPIPFHPHRYRNRSLNFCTSDAPQYSRISADIALQTFPSNKLRSVWNTHAEISLAERGNHRGAQLGSFKFNRTFVPAAHYRMCKPTLLYLFLRWSSLWEEEEEGGSPPIYACKGGGRILRS